LVVVVVVREGGGHSESRAATGVAGWSGGGGGGATPTSQGECKSPTADGRLCFCTAGICAAAEYGPPPLTA
jgi:hypothetical protein